MRDNTTPLPMPESPAIAASRVVCCSHNRPYRKQSTTTPMGIAMGLSQKYSPVRTIAQGHAFARQRLEAFPPRFQFLTCIHPTARPCLRRLRITSAHSQVSGGFPVTFPRAAGGSTSSSSTRAGCCARHCSSWSRHVLLCFVHHCATDVLLGCRMSCPSLITAITCHVLQRFRQSADQPLFEASVVYSSSSSSSHSVLPRTVRLICPS